MATRQCHSVDAERIFVGNFALSFMGTKYLYSVYM